MKIYTKTGDKGDTSLFGGERRSKADLRIESYGSVDELQAVLGVALAELNQIHSEWTGPLRKVLEDIQADTFILCAELARPGSGTPTKQTPVLPDSSVERLEKSIDAYDSELPALRNFIMQGGSRAGAMLHLARAVCRRAERQVVLLHQKEEVRPLVLEYLNRLSDLLFVLARFTNKQLGVEEIAWK